MKKTEDAVHKRWQQVEKEFGTKLRQFREGIGTSQTEFAKRLGCSVRVLIDLEGGKYRSPDILVHLQNRRGIGR
jgi:transcriptional regulator with XRE-family HTH domain